MSFKFGGPTWYISRVEIHGTVEWYATLNHEVIWVESHVDADTFANFELADSTLQLYFNDIDGQTILNDEIVKEIAREE
jgi:hypothetical protein